MALKVKAKWKGYNNASAGLETGKVYDLDYEIKGQEIVVSYYHEGERASMTFSNVKDFAAKWQQPKQ